MDAVDRMNATDGAGAGGCNGRLVAGKVERPVLIVNLNDTIEELAQRRGVLAEWISRGLRLPAERIAVVDPRNGAELPDPAGFCGVVVSGSAAMITDQLEWSQRTSAWLAGVIAAGLPVLGICYGHQLIADALGGHVSWNPNGREFGTVEIRLLPEAADDVLLSHLPPVFAAQASHSQSVLRLPEGAVRLAENGHDRHHAFRVGRCVWGLQFHPEFDADIVRTYARVREEGLRRDNLDPDKIIAAAADAPESASVLARFGQICCDAATIRR
jgi:GMP synthase (glutamine-hydrolysing)